MSTKFSLGIFGGSFDPIHIGHIEPVMHSAKLLQLNAIKLIPAYVSPLKDKTIASAEHRMAMVELVADEFELFEADFREITKTKQSYTIETLRTLANEYPDAELYFFAGTDSLLSFTQWHEWQEFLELANLVITPRPGYTFEEIDKSLLPFCRYFADPQENQNSARPAIWLMPPCPVDISSTEIRANLAKNSSLLPEAVANYIKAHQLYL